MPTEIEPPSVVWIVTLHGFVSEVVVNSEGVVTYAESPVEWAVGDKWTDVLALVEIIGNAKMRDPIS